MTSQTTPTSYVVIVGPTGPRAYFTDDTDTLRAAAPTDDGSFDFDGAQAGMIGMDLLADPKLARPAGNAVATLRDTLTAHAKAASQPGPAKPAAALPLDEAA